LGAVQGNVLEADKVFSVGDAARDGHGEAGRVYSLLESCQLIWNLYDTRCVCPHSAA
jgi:hypothetical protein